MINLMQLNLNLNSILIMDLSSLIYSSAVMFYLQLLRQHLSPFAHLIIHHII